MHIFFITNIKIKIQFQKTREKLKPYSGCTREICSIEYKVLIHSSKESLNNDLHSSNPIVTVKYKKKTKALITKIKLHSISTEENYCAPEDTLIRCACQLKKVKQSNISIYLVSYRNHIVTFKINRQMK